MFLVYSPVYCPILLLAHLGLGLWWLGRIYPQLWQADPYFTGKLCLQHEDLAKKCIAALARELEVSHDVAVRNNVVIVMCDLCVRYTTMVDRYIPNISLCLKDPHPFIRKQTLILITNLLQVNRVPLLLCWALAKRRIAYNLILEHSCNVS